MMLHMPEIADGPLYTSPALWHQLATVLIQESSAAPQSIALHQRQRCGLWLTVQRSRRGYSEASLSINKGVTPDILQMLEAGLAQLSFAEDDRWNVTASVLADSARNADLVLAVIRTACGEVGLSTERILARVDHDLALAADE